MTFEELQIWFPDATLDTWKSHQNGGGWVQNTATVAETAWIGPNAIVSWNAEVSGYAMVYGDARVFGSARVFGAAEISEFDLVYGNDRIND